MTVSGFLSQLLQVAVALMLAPLLAGWVAQCRAWLSNRSAPSLLLPYRTIRKLFLKDAVVAANASPLFRLTPYIVFGAMCCAAAIVPSLATDLPFAHAADAIALVGLFALARVFMALAAMDIGTAFGSLGARRDMFIGFLAEPALLMVLFTASLISGSTSLPEIVDTLAHREFGIYPSLAFAGVAFTMVSLAENARVPVDNPATHLELTMIHEVMVLDHGGPDLGLVQYAAALKLWVLGALLVGVALPVQGLVPWAGPAVSLAGMAALAVLVGIVETVMARLKLVRVPQLLAGAAALSVLAIVLVTRG